MATPVPVETITAIGTVIGIVAVMVLRDYRDGKPIFKKNSNGNSHEGLGEIREQLNTIQTELSLLNGNHLEHLQTGVNDANKKMDEFTRVLDRLLYVLEDIKNNGVKCRD